ncbi:hypothetical protein LY76DRAFT_596196 [Colletotrichum caudatum]|nr:hypothetical protein LY76DRAFT_596196 [Colletotrichum caudatum]
MPFSSCIRAAGVWLVLFPSLISPTTSFHKQIGPYRDAPPALSILISFSNEIEGDVVQQGKTPPRGIDKGSPV